MKKSISLLGISLLLVVLTILSCKKETPVVEAKNFFKLDSVEYGLAKGAIEDNGYDSLNQEYYYTMILVSEGIIFVKKNGEIDSTYGMGNVVLVDLSSTSANGPATGKYKMSDNETAKNNCGGELYIGLIVGSPDEPEQDISFDSGSVDIVRTGDFYKVSFNFIGDDNQKISGSFEGELKVYKE